MPLALRTKNRSWVVSMRMTSLPGKPKKLINDMAPAAAAAETEESDFRVKSKKEKEREKKEREKQRKKEQVLSFWLILGPSIHTD